MNNNETWLNDLQKLVDDAHLTTDRAELPPLGLWNHIRAQVQPIEEPKEHQPMINTASVPQVLSSPFPSRSVGETGGFRHYANLVATVALVLAVAVGGWLAMSQMPGGDGNGRFAGLPGTPEVAQSPTCDIEPLSVNEVMEIVKNPYTAYDPADISSRDQLRIWEDYTNSELVETIYPVIDQQLLAGFTYPASNMGFEDAVDRANGFLSCAQSGTVGQIFNYFDPREVQRIVLSPHPVFRDEASVRASVELLLEFPAGNLVFPGRPNLQGTDLTLTINPESENALVAMGTPATRYEATKVMMLGIVATNSEGNIVYRSNAEGVASPDSGLDRESQFRVIMKQSSVDGKWYNLATWPEILYVD